jgi:predicted HTH domain antitoxin
MPDFIDILVDTEQPLQAFVYELEQILHISFEKWSELDADLEGYESSDELYTIGITTHEYVNERDLRFEEYRYDVGIEAKYRESWEKTSEEWRAFAQHIFDKLKATGKYRLLMVENLQRKLDQFDANSS